MLNGPCYELFLPTSLRVVCASVPRVHTAAAYAAEIRQRELFSHTAVSMSVAHDKWVWRFTSSELSLSDLRARRLRVHATNETSETGVVGAILASLSNGFTCAGNATNHPKNPALHAFHELEVHLSAHKP